MTTVTIRQYRDDTTGETALAVADLRFSSLPLGVIDEILADVDDGCTYGTVNIDDVSYSWQLN
jgi:hypothetical protein